MDAAKYNNQPTIIFLHIPKTAGTTLNAILDSYYPREKSYTTYSTPRYPDGSLEELKAFTEAEKARLDLIEGHLAFGVHELLPRPAV
ncbi:MAG: hypothetical protein L0332_19435, partial [Chloroflexi bacterium]|nr:hypothetical protein [Chloroflexota bacterium]